MDDGTDLKDVSKAIATMSKEELHNVAKIENDLLAILYYERRKLFRKPNNYEFLEQYQHEIDYCEGLLKVATKCLIQLTQQKQLLGKD